MGLSPLQVQQVARTSGVDIRNKRVRFLQFSWLWLFERFSLNTGLYVRVKYKLDINAGLNLFWINFKNFIIKTKLRYQG